jgi:putative methyltransferase (TIGR04325 family)
MNKKDIIKSFIPPIVLQFIRSGRSKSYQRTDLPEWEYVPEGWTYAQSHSEVKGWNVQEILDVYKRKWPRFLDLMQGTGPLGIAHESELTTNDDIHAHNVMMSLAYALALASHDASSLSILDWGGGIGHFYVIAKKVLPDVEIEYHCKDVALLAEYGSQLFPDQHFYSDETCFRRKYNFVMASASLHYAERWQRLFENLAAVADPFLYVANLPTIVTAPSFVFIQRPYAYGYNTQYLGWCLNRTDFLSWAEALGLELLREFVTGMKPMILNAPGQNEYRSFLFRLCNRPQQPADSPGGF